MDEIQDEGIAWPSYVDFLSVFVFVLFLMIGSMLYIQTGDIVTQQFLINSKNIRETLRELGIESQIRGRMVLIPLKNRVEFAQNDAELTPRHKEFLRGIGKSFKDAATCRRIIVAGYADGTIFRKDEFGNWRLSARRALSVLQFFYTCDDCGYGPEIKNKLVLAAEGATGSVGIGPDSGARRVDVIIDYTEDQGR